MDHIIAIRPVVYPSSALISNALTGTIRGDPGGAAAFFSREDLDVELVGCHVEVPPMSERGKIGSVRVVSLGSTKRPVLVSG